MDTKFGFGKMVDLGFEEAVDTVTEELGKEGFGVLTEIDVQATLKKKLGEDMRPYKILGACNPPLAHQAVLAVPEIGLLLPCNVLVREDDEGQVHVQLVGTGEAPPPGPTVVLEGSDRLGLGRQGAGVRGMPALHDLGAPIDLHDHVAHVAGIALELFACH